tara:strand:- start:3247 stop:4227 length:981 start_codon:yes stop_codon:yes gene_type:complete
MRYPLDENTDQYLGKIHFIPIAEKYVDIGSIANSAITDLSFVAIEQFGDDQVQDQVQTSNHRGHSRAVAPDPRRGHSRAVSNQKSMQVPLTSYGQTASGPITLYLPQAIVISDAVNYERINLGIIGATALGALQSGSSIPEAVRSGFMEAGKSTIDLLRNKSAMSSQLASLAAVRLAEGIGNDTFRGVSRAAFGTAVNPNTRSLFNSVELRTFTFQFKMIASSEAEANAIEQIIKTFRKEIYPREILGPQDVSVGYIFPNKFRVIMTYNKVRVATQFLDSNLLSIQTTYNPSSMGWHAKGKPSEVDLTVNFGEPRVLSKKDIEDGY